MGFTSNMVLVSLPVLFASIPSIFASIDPAPAAITKEDVVREASAGTDTETALSLTDFAAGARLRPVDLRTIGIDVPADPTLSAGRHEGDLALEVPVTTFVQNSNLDAIGVQSKSTIRSVWRRWPDGVIPYTLSSRYGKYSRSVIARAMDEFHKRSCVRFEPRDTQRDYVYIHPDDGCYSLVGRTGGRQPLSLDAGCIDVGTVMHELMHTVGFFHEQSRNDRDDWIDIAWGNVQFEARDQFERYSLSTINDLGVGYDYGSLMHYGPYAFTRNGRQTILAKKPGAHMMGQRDGFSEKDVDKLLLLYGEKCFTEGGSVGAIGGGAVKPKPEVTTAQLRCEDDERYAFRCRLWSTRIFNYCESLEEVRTVLCPKSCDACAEASGKGDGDSGTDTDTGSETAPPSPPIAPSTVVVAVCKDSNPGCDRWRDKGFCDDVNFANYMRQTCEKSCGMCGTPAASTGAERPAPAVPPAPVSVTTGTGGDESATCVDHADYEVVCRLAKLFNRCNPATASEPVKRHCRKSCAMCS